MLDFDIKSNADVKDEPDIIEIIENKKHREPHVFIEIKNTSENDRWIGLTEEQFNTIKRSANGNEIYMIYASIYSKTVRNNPKTTDLTGMFLKEIEDKTKSSIFQKIANLNAKCKIEFIISSKELEQFSFPFDRGMNMYETRLFEEKKKTSFYSQGGTKVRKDVLEIKIFNNFDGIKYLEISKDVKAENNKISQFHIKGDFKLITKTKKTYIECVSDVLAKNEIFGLFELKKGRFYSFNLITLGRDPKLKRNNLFISKKMIYQLMQNKKIKDPEIVIKDIANKI